MKAAVIGLLASLVLAAGCSTNHPVAKAAPSEPSFASSLPHPSALGSPSPGPSPSIPASPSPTPSALASPVAVPDSPSPAGSPVAAQILPPATVLPAVPLCVAPIERYQDGNAGPLFCRSGAIVVAAWAYFAPADPHVLSVGRGPSLTAVESAICADGSINHATWPMEQSGYQLAAAYYGWNLVFDIEQFQQHGTCP